MEIIKKSAFIKAIYNNIINTYGLKLSIENENYIKLENENIIIKFITDRYYHNDDSIGNYIYNKKNNNGYLVLDISEKMGFYQSNYLPQNKREEMLALPDGISKLIYTAAYFLEHYGDKILEGDFSIMEQ